MNTIIKITCTTIIVNLHSILPDNWLETFFKFKGEGAETAQKNIYKYAVECINSIKHEDIETSAQASRLMGFLYAVTVNIDKDQIDQMSDLLSTKYNPNVKSDALNCIIINYTYHFSNKNHIENPVLKNTKINKFISDVFRAQIYVYKKHRQQNENEQ